MGETLTAVTTGIMDADGLTSPTYAYQWIRVNGTDADISGATSSTYTLVVADEGTTIKVKVSFTDDDGNSETLTSAATATVAAAATTPTISAVAVTSTPQLETDTYGEGEEIQFTVTFSEAVTVTGMPQFVFSLGNAGDTRRVNAGYDAAASTDTELVFAYTVVATDEDDNGIFILDDATVRGMSGSGSIVLGMGGSIVGKTSAVPASVAHSVRAAQSGHKVDGSPNSPATGAPTITGTARVGETLTAVTSGITDADGLTSPTYTYQWIRVETDSSETDISGATSSTYTLVDADLGTTIKMRATFDDDAGNSETRTSAATATVAAANSPATGAPTITGTARVGETLTAVTSGIMDADGLASPTYTYQWIRVNGTDADISGATSSTYTLVVADEGKTIKVKVTFDDDAGNTETRTSAATATVAAANTPATGAPTITGTARVGETLTAVTSGITDADGLASPTYTYQWIRVDTDSTETDISGATSSTYTLVVADLGTTIKMRATFEDDAGNSETRTSVATATVVAANTPATGAPTITGTARVDETLTAATTGIMDADGLASPTYAYQWIRVDSGTDADISGATSSTYTLVAADEGTTIKVKVSFTDDAGNSETLTSAATATVAAIAPLTVQMTPSPPPPVEGAFSLRFSFSGEVRGFTSGDIETQQEPACTDSANNPISCNPTIAALQTTDNRIFTTTVNPRTAGVNHNYTLTLTVPAGRVTSAAGNKPNEEAMLEVRVAPPGVTVPISSLGRTASPGNGQVTLSWNTPQNTGGSAIIRYEYRWAESGGEFGDWMSVGPSERSATVPNLTNGREYVFEVRGVNALGYGPVETASATPESGGGGGGRGGGGFPQPPRPPANNRPMADAGPDQTGVREGALVTLDGSGSSDPDDDPLKYRWNQYRGERVALSSRDVVNPTFTAPRELTADVVLSFRLLVTDPGGRFDTDTVEVTVTVTDEDNENPGKPLAPTVSAATPYSLMVEWMEPENSGPAITDYDVQYREGDSGDGFTDAQHQGTARTATLTGLMPDTVYEVQVRATNATGTGDWSESGEGKTKTLQTGDQIYYFPHLAVGASWQTTITYINYSREEVTCQTDFLSDHGTPLMVSFAELGTVDSRTDVLPPGGSVHQETDVELSAPLAPGWALANCSGPVKASLLYRQHNSEGMPVAEAGVNATAVPATRFVTFAEQGEGKNGTGVAYANPSATAALVTFTARDADGEVLAIEDLMLPPNGHGAQNMPTLFDLSSFTGSLEVTSTEPIVSLSLNFEAAPVFSSLPPGELDASAQGSTTYYFPHLAVGASWQTTITYINYSREEVTCQTDFISDHGSPLMVSFAELGTVDSRTDVLPPGGSVHQETNVELSAPLAPGWARANCTGPVQASLLFRWYNSEGMPVAEAGVNAATVPATRFVTFAEQGEGKNGTGVAYANPSDTAALVTFTARDADGEVLAIEDLMLPPNWHGAQNMPTLFDLSSFTGSLEVTSTEPIVSLSLNFEAAPVFSSLPPGELDDAAQ